ncbi:unnamed protein product [Allacma fusca]|uniref:Uncharacterized protein n=1 Tax=Allacma fusca TaxID=39272 RepID=A0A8J2KYZ6_9HEXA|nr:unnamed protein product [Allacma fusca]
MAKYQTVVREWNSVVRCGVHTYMVVNYEIHLIIVDIYKDQVVPGAVERIAKLRKNSQPVTYSVCVDTVDLGKYCTLVYLKTTQTNSSQSTDMKDT